MLAAAVLFVGQVAEAPPPPPQLPSFIIGDYFPGPWTIFIDPKTGRPDADAAAIAAQADAMFDRLPDIRALVCPFPQAGTTPSARDARLHAMAVTGLLRASHRSRAEIGDSTRCPTPAPPRAMPGVSIIPSPRM